MLNHSEIALICIALLLIASFWKKTVREKLTYPTLDLVSTEQLRGLAIILVVFGHLCSGFINLPIFKYSGAQGVSIFLILSGFGLAKSYLKKGIDEHFFARRFKTVLLPYMLVTGTIIALDYIVHQSTIPKGVILASLVGLNMQVDPTMWYISFIFLWYLAFYVIFGLRISNPAKLMLLFLFSFVIKFTIPSNSTLLNAPYEYSLHAFAFPIGIMAALYSTKIVSFLQTKRALAYFLSIVSILLFLGFVIFFRSISFEHQTIYMLINLMLAISLIIAFMLLSYLRIESKLLVKLGEYSYEIYLLEAIFFTRYNMLNKLSSKWETLLLYIFMVLLFSFILNKLSKLLLSKGDKKLVRLKKPLEQ